MEQMSAIRDQQESLAKLHFEIGARQDPSAPLSEEGTHYYLSINENHVYALVSGVYFLCPSHQSSRHQGEYMLVIIVVVLVFSYKP